MTFSVSVRFLPIFKRNRNEPPAVLRGKPSNYICTRVARSGSIHHGSLETFGTAGSAAPSGLDGGFNHLTGATVEMEEKCLVIFHART